MEKYLKYFVLTLATVLSLSLASCGGGDDDEPDQPGKPSTTDVVSGSASESSRINIIDGGDYYSPYFIWRGNTISVKIHGSGYSYVKMVSVGNVSKLCDIKTVPGEGWSTSLPLVNNGGYVITYTLEGKAYYIRLFITFNVSAAGDLVGINYQFQHFTPAQ